METPGSDDNTPPTSPPNPSSEKANGIDFDAAKERLSSFSVREAVGSGMHQFTELVNNNLIAARFGAFAGITLLTVYGFSQTPLFFRYRTVSELPASYFLGRRRLYARIIGVGKPPGKDTTMNSIQHPDTIHLQVRHLSPMGRILPKSWFDALMRYTPSAGRLGQRTHSKPEENIRDLLQVQLAGVQHPPTYNESYQPEQLLEQLAKERALVSIQLLARRRNPTDNIQTYGVHDMGNSYGKTTNATNKRELSTVLPELDASAPPTDSEPTRTRSRFQSNHNPTAEEAIVRISYRSETFQLFSDDLAEKLVSSGCAEVSTTIFGKGSDTTAALTADPPQALSMATIVDSSQRTNDLRSDTKYLERLNRAELQAVEESKGMWSLPEVRDERRDIVEEVHFQKNANLAQKLWRWIRGG
eukprot:Nitzschia sp. Nitz4//scaffold162_size51285//5984//7401//NITZ4_006964-RA/size51285-augustus-gene-0.21-mRNA-1//1//CDS//3329537958//3395//frame0